MITRMFKGRRPRKAALAALAAGMFVGIGLIANGALAEIPPPPADTGCTGGPAPNSVEVPTKETSESCTTGDGALVDYIGSSAANESSGTGIFDPFVRLQADGTEEGFNTNADVTLDAKAGKWTHAILVSAIPIVNIGGTNYWELFVDINENNNTKPVSLNKLEIYFAPGPGGATITGYPGFAGFSATLQYAFDGEIKINDVNQGSGRGDLRYLVPLTDIPTPPSSTFFVLYSEWGTTSGYSSDGGFEEWKVRKAPNVTIVKTEDAASVNAGSNIGFTITVTNNGAADATGVTINDPLPGGAGIDWSESPDNPDCSISGSPSNTPPDETLNCGPVTLAAGGGKLEVHVQSATTADSCGTYPNTATFTSTNAGTGSDSASVTVNCGAIRILKNSTKGGAVNQFGTQFGVDGPDVNTTADFNVTDDDADPFVRDRDAGKGVICVDGLQPGAMYTVTEVTPPTGYGTGTAVDDTAEAVAGSCTTATFATVNVATFSNPPTFDIQVNFRDGGSGETNVTPPTGKIDCDNNGAGADTPDASPQSGWDTSVTHTSLSVSPGPTETIVCTIVVDP